MLRRVVPWGAANYAPRWPFAINRASPLAQGLIRFWPMQAPFLREMVRGDPVPTLGGTAEHIPIAATNSFGLHTDANGEYIRAGDIGTLSPPVTLVAYGIPTSSSTSYAGLMYTRGGTGGGIAGMHQYSLSAKLSSGWGGGAGYSSGTFPSFSLNIPGIFAVVFTPTAMDRYVIQNGVLASGTHSQTNNPLNFARLDLAYDNNNANRTFRGEWFWFAIFGRQLFEAELRALERAPWQLIEELSISPVLKGQTATTISASGTPQAIKATLSGAVGVIVKSSGTPAATRATVAGAVAPIVKASGAVTAVRATVAGTVAGVAHATGAVTAQSAAASGAGKTIVKTTGAPAAQSATASGVSAVIVKSNGAPAAVAATLTGASKVIVKASGAVQAAAATSSGGSAVIGGEDDDYTLLKRPAQRPGGYRDGSGQQDQTWMR